MQPQPIRTTRLILIALIAGLALLAGVATFLRATSDSVEAPAGLDVLPVVVLASFVGAAGVAFVVRRKFTEQARANRESSLALLREERLPSEVARACIVGAAIAEGPGLLASMTVLIGGPVYLLAGTVLSMAWIAFLIPTRERVEAMLRESY